MASQGHGFTKETQHVSLSQTLLLTTSEGPHSMYMQVSILSGGLNGAALEGTTGGWA
jgi:hypothetical protein